MTCEKCGGLINSAGKCVICGYDREATDAKFAVIREKREKKRSIRMKFFTGSVVFGCLIMLLSGILMNDPGLIVLRYFLLIDGSFRLMLAIFIYLYRKWAFCVYMAESVLWIFVEFLISPINIFSFMALGLHCFFNIVFCYWFVSKDWHKFK